MFGFGKKKKITLAAPVPGRILDITAVPDAVFADKVMGDGFAVEPEGDTVAAPCDAEVAFVPETRHAVALVRDGIELLIHVGIDTVALEGRGFTAFVKKGDRVKAGDPLLRFDAAVIRGAGKPLTTEIVVTNMDAVESLRKNLADAAAVLTVEKK